MAELSLLYFFDVDWLSSDSNTVGSGVRYLKINTNNKQNKITNFGKSQAEQGVVK